MMAAKSYRCMGSSLRDIERWNGIRKRRAEVTQTVLRATLQRDSGLWESLCSSSLIGVFSAGLSLGVPALRSDCRYQHGTQ